MSQPPFIANSCGKYLPLAHLSLSLHDRGLVWGAVVVERLRTYRHRPFLLEPHLARFLAGCSALNLAISASAAELQRQVEDLLARNSGHLLAGEEYFIVLLATPGISGHEPTLLIFPERLDPRRYGSLLSEGAVLHTPAVRAMPAACVPTGIKHRSRLHWWLAEQEAKAADPAATALLLDAENCCTETWFGNILFQIDGSLRTPPAAGILPGVTLQVVRDLAADLAVRWEEQPVPLPDALRAEEAILTGTAFGLAPVRLLNQKVYPAPGPLFARLWQAWERKFGIPPH